MALTDWLKDTGNQNLLKFLGGATVTVVGAGWAGYQALYPAKPVVETPKPPVVAASAVIPASPAVTTSQVQTITAISGSAATGNITGGTVTFNVGK